MPSFSFKGFTTGSPVALAASQGALSDDGTTPTWGQPGSGTLTATAVLPTRIVAPAGIWLEADNATGFDVSGPGTGETYDPRFHEITQIWNTDDSGSWSAPENMLPVWNDKSVAYGPHVCHTFDTPGTYVPSVWAVDSSGTTGFAETGSITVLDPDDVYSGPATIVIALDGVFTGKPPGATEVQSIAALQVAIDALNDALPARVLFKRGEEYQNVHLNVGSEMVEYFGAWGVGDRPILNGTKYAGSGNAQWVFHYGKNPLIEQLTITDLDMRSHWDVTGEVGYANQPLYMWNVRNDDVHITIHNVIFSKFSLISADCGTQGNRPYRLVCSDCEVTGWRNYGFFQNRNTNPEVKVGWVGCKVAQNAAAIHGTTYSAYSLRGNDHGPIRFEAVGNSYIGVCDLFSCTGWAPLAPDQALQPCVRMNTYPDYTSGFSANVERCVMEGGNHTINMSGQNGASVDNPGNYLFDKLVLIGSAKSSTSGAAGIFFNHHFGGLTVRNVLGILPDVAQYHTDTPASYCMGFDIDNASTQTPNEPINVYNNTFVNLRNTTNDPGYTWSLEEDLNANFNNTTVENNVLYAPGIDTPVDSDGPLDTTTTISNITTRFRGFLIVLNETGTLSSAVADDAYFSLGYPAGTDQAYWQAIEGTDTEHMLHVSGPGTLYAGNGEFEVDFTQPSEVRIYNRTGASWSVNSAWELRLDQRSQHSIPGTYASPPTIPLPRPDTGSAAIGDGNTGRKAYDDLLMKVRPATGNDRGALLR